MTEEEAFAAMEAILASYPEEQRGEAAKVMLEDAAQDLAVIVGQQEAARILREFGDAILRGEFDA